MSKEDKRRMENVKMLLGYKTKECQNPTCILKNSKEPELYRASRCFDFHSDSDKRRPPFDFDSSILSQKDDLLNKLTDKGYSMLSFFRDLLNNERNEIELKAKYGSFYAQALSGEEGCRNVEEFAFHPINFKRAKCPAGQGCQEPLCFRFHDRMEEEDFRNLQAVVYVPQGPVEALSQANEAAKKGLEALEIRRKKVEDLVEKRLEEEAPQPSRPRSPANYAHRPARTGKSNERGPYVRSMSRGPAHRNRSASKVIKKGKTLVLPNTNKSNTFFLDSQVSFFEKIQVEFKQFMKLDIQTAADYVCAFLNSFGGSLYFGINDEGVVKGIPLTRKEIDTFQINLDIALRNFSPRVFPDLVKIEFHEICYTEEFVVANKYVVQIDVFPDCLKNFYVTDRNEFIVKKQGSINKLSYCELIQYVQQRSVLLAQCAAPTLSVNPQVLHKMSKDELANYSKFLDKLQAQVKEALARN